MLIVVNAETRSWFLRRISVSGHTHTHTHTCVYIYCVCVYDTISPKFRDIVKGGEKTVRTKGQNVKSLTGIQLNLVNKNKPLM